MGRGWSRISEWGFKWGLTVCPNLCYHLHVVEQIENSFTKLSFAGQKHHFAYRYLSSLSEIARQLTRIGLYRHAFLLRLLLTFTLTRWPWYTNWRFRRCICVPKMYFLGQLRLSKITALQTDTQMRLKTLTITPHSVSYIKCTRRLEEPSVWERPEW